MTQESIVPWMDCLNTLLLQPLPEASEGLQPAGQPLEVEERLRWPWYTRSSLRRFSPRIGCSWQTTVSMHAVCAAEPPN